MRPVPAASSRAPPIVPADAADAAPANNPRLTLNSLPHPLGAPNGSSDVVATSPLVSARTRSHARIAAIAAVDSALEACSGDLVDSYNCALYQFLGGDSALFECRSADGIDNARWRLLCDAHALSEPAPLVASSAEHSTEACMRTVCVFDAALSTQLAECYKASQNVVDVNTPSGTLQLTVPATLRQLHLSAQKEEWLGSDQKALDAILAWPGNRLVAQSVPFELGQPIAPCVTQRKIKIDPATGRLEARNAFKSRHCVDGGRLAAVRSRLASKLEDRGQQVNDTSSAVADNLLIKLLLADSAARGRTLLKADVPNAYVQGKRLGRPLTYMALPSCFTHMRGNDGEPLCIELATPMWGENEAGFEWQVELESTLASLGWRRAENVAACWTFSGPEGDAVCITVVDDLLFSESSSSNFSISEKLIAQLSDRYGDLRAERKPTSFAGYSLTYNEDGSLCLSMPQKIIEAAREHLPSLIEGVNTNLPHGKKLTDLADRMALPSPRPPKLTARAVQTQRLIGSLKFIEQLHPRLSLILHRLSCVMSSPPPESWEVACAALEMAYQDRERGITYGGGHIAKLGGDLRTSVDLDGSAPEQLETHADACWGTDRDLYGLLLTYAGACVLHQTKKIALIVDSSMESEAIASAKAGEVVAYAIEVLRALGVPPDGPVLLTTDNLANQKIVSGLGSPSRSRHFIRRYGVLRQRIRSREVHMQHIPDAQMPADFLTKWLFRPKLEKSLRYATNQPRSVV